MAGTGPTAGLMPNTSGLCSPLAADAVASSPLVVAAGMSGSGIAFPLVSHIEDDVGAGVGAADQHLSAAGGFQRGRGVGDVTGQQRRDAGVADAGPATPPGGDVAGVGKVEHAAPVVAEGRGDATAGEGDQWPGTGRAGWLVG